MSTNGDIPGYSDDSTVFNPEFTSFTMTAAEEFAVDALISDPRYCPTPPMIDGSMSMSPCQSFSSAEDDCSSLSSFNPELDLLRLNSPSGWSRSSTPYNDVSYHSTPAPSDCSPEYAYDHTGNSITQNEEEWERSSSTCTQRTTTLDDSCSTVAECSKGSGEAVKERECLDEACTNADSVTTTTEVKKEGGVKKGKHQSTRKSSVIVSSKRSGWSLPNGMVTKRKKGEMCTRTMPIRFGVERSQKTRKSPKPQKTFPCPESWCTYVAKTASHLHAHNRSFHLHEKNYECETDGCDAGFFTLSGFTRHMEGVHGKIEDGAGKYGKKRPPTIWGIPSTNVPQLVNRYKSLGDYVSNNCPSLSKPYRRGQREKE